MELDSPQQYTNLYHRRTSRKKTFNGFDYSIDVKEKEGLAKKNA